MARIAETPRLSPGQAQYVIERLVSDGRISSAEVARYVGDIHREIGELEARLRRLRNAEGSRTPAQPAAAERPSAQPRRRRRRGRKRHGNPLAGRYMGYMRQVPAAQQEKYRRLKQEQGYDAAIAQLKSDLRK